MLLESNRKQLRKSGTVIYLHASIGTLLARTRKSRSRPLLENEDPRRQLERLMKIREPLYRQEADLVINAEHRSQSEVIRDIIGRLGQR